MHWVTVDSPIQLQLNVIVYLLILQQYLAIGTLVMRLNDLLYQQEFAGGILWSKNFSLNRSFHAFFEWIDA